MGTDVTDDLPTDSPVSSVGEVVVSPLLRGHAQANDSTILEALQKGRFQEFAFGPTPGTVRTRGDVTVAVVHDSRGE